MENSEQDEVLFPSEEEIKSYFPDDVWNTMAEYERKSYRNMLHNYNVMKSLDLKPIKPSFMTLYQKKASKRKATSNLCRLPTKKPQTTKEKSLTKGKEMKEQWKTEQKKTKHQKTNQQKMGQQKTEQQKKAPVIFDDSHKRKSISLHCVFAAVFKVYKRYHGIIKGHYPRKKKTLKVSEKHLKKNVENNMEECENNGVISVSQDVNVGGSNSVGECSNEKIAVVATEEHQISTDVKVEECAKPSIRSAAPQTKPVCRSVQTMTAAVGCSPSTSALVFVNAATAKKMSFSFPDPKPLTPLEQKRMKKINQKRMKNRRNVQTQTAAEDSSVEEAKLVFFPVPKAKKPKTNTASTQTDNTRKEELLETETQQDGVAAENPDDKQSVVSSLSPTENEETAKPSGNDEKEKYNDASSEDEFGFYALFRQENDAKTNHQIATSSDQPNIPETKPHPDDSDLAVPGCSGLQSGPLKSRSTDKRIGLRPGSCMPTDSSDEDEFGFFQLEKDANAKKDFPAKPNIPKIKAQPKDIDLAVPGCSSQSPALVFVNAATAKKMSFSFPDPKPLTPLEQKRMKKINQKRMKNRRNVQTQTAAEDSSVEEAKLVFFPVPKSKKPKSKTASTQADNTRKEELLETETQQDGVAAENPDDKQSVVASLAPTENEETAKPSGNDEKEKYNDASSEDEFGFYALFRQENDAKTNHQIAKSSDQPNIPESKPHPEDSDLAVPGCSGLRSDAKTNHQIATSSDQPNIPETKPHPEDSDLAVPGCSGLQSGLLKSRSTDKRIGLRPGSCMSTDSSDEDEFGFFQLEKDANAKKDFPAKPNIPKIKAQPKDIDLAVPGCSSQSPERRYPRRALPVIDYTEGELLQDDEYLFCDLCDREYEGDCPEHGPHKYYPDRSAPVTGDGGRAIQTTPAMLKIDKSKIPGAGSGVWTMVGLPPHVRFGPYQGDKISEPDPLGYSWAIVKDKRVDHYIAAQSTATSNWMRFVNCARHETEQNLMAFQYKGQMYYRTVKLIPPKAELFVWYGKEYAEQLGISMENFRSKDTSHLRNLVFTCDKCNVTYTSPLYLEVHGKKCGGKRAPVIVEPSRVPTDVQTLAVVVDGRKTYCCNLCSYKTVFSSHIRNHLVTHGGEKPHVCDVCGKGFTRAGNLDTHKLIHTGVKPFKCDQCPYSCHRVDNLRWHMTRHTMEKVFACPLCDYKTAISSNMKSHSRTHSGVKPYCCTLCPYRAAVSGAVTSHMRTHTGEKPYACPHCQCRFTVKGNLNKHIDRKHSAQK